MDCIQIVCSLNSSHALGRFETSPRFHSLLRIAAIGYKIIVENKFPRQYCIILLRDV